MLFSLLIRDSLRSLQVLVLLALAVVAAGCGGGSDSSDGGPPDAGPATCETGELPLDDGGCTVVGLPPGMPCPLGVIPLDELHILFGKC